MRPTFACAVLCLVLALAGCETAPPANDDGGTDGGGDRPDTGPPDAPAAACEDAADCDDGTFCNGEEQCTPASPDADARGCVAAAAARCLEGQTCDEAGDRCQSDCDVSSDADGDGADSIDCGGTDCDDADGNRFPGNPEICDAANRDEDCDPVTFGFRDSDMDDEVDARCCNADGADMNCGADCDDMRASVGPTATEACNGRDDDCDASTDEDVLVTLFLDSDGDGFGDPAMSMMGCPGAIPMHVDLGTDCDDTEGSINPAASDTCDAEMVDEDCSGVPNDPPGGCDCTTGMMRPCTASGICSAGVEMCVDGMFGPCSIAPEAFEVCDLEDDDCNGVVDDGLRRDCWVDTDGDGYALATAMVSQQCATPGGGCPVGYSNRDPALAGNLDCDDTAAGRSPGGTETCNSIDDDCDGVPDEMLTVVCYVDEDNDTYAAMTATAQNVCPNAARMSVGFCPLGYTNRAPSGPTTRDCNDAPGVGFDFRPGAPELCDSMDNDCDGVVDDGARATCFADGDDDGYAAMGAASSMQCRDATRPDRGDCPRNFTFRDPAVAADRDCAEGDPSRYPGAVELCDAIDQDCDGSTADAVMVTCFADPDNDTYAASGVAGTMVCPDPTRGAVGNCPSGYTNRMPAAGATDCAPMDPTRHPAVTEMCDEPTFVDANCNPADEGSLTCYRDIDDDGYATFMSSVTIQACLVTSRNDSIHLGCPTGYTGRVPSTDAAADCNDGSVSQRVIVQCYTDSDRDGYRSATSSLSRQCYTTGAGVGNCPLGMTGTVTPTDCCDADVRAFPGATSYYDTARTTCGGYDYNCDMAETRQLTQNWGSQSCVGLTFAACEGDVTPGWSTTTDPACGASGLWVDCFFIDDLPPPGPATECSRGEMSRRQPCR